MVNDISIIIGIVAVFILVGSFLPAVNDAFGISPEDTACFKVTQLESELGNATIDLDSKENWWTEFVEPINPIPKGSLTIFDVMFSIIKMFFWTCGALPVWLDIVFLIVRIALIIIIARNIWIGGGG